MKDMELENKKYIIVEIIPTHSQSDKGFIAQISALKLDGLQLEDRFDYRVKDNLIEKDELQLSLFSHQDNEKQEKLDKVVDELKQKYGYNSITRAGKLHSENKIKLKDI